MKRWVAAAFAGILALAGMVATDPAAAAPPAKSGVSAAPASVSTDLSARRHQRTYRRYAYRPQPYYYDRPTYYRPYPYAVPAPFFLGFAYSPWGW